MSYNRYLYDKLCEEHRQTMQREAAQTRLLVSLPHRHNLVRRAIGRLGIALVAVGSKLKPVDHYNVVEHPPGEDQCPLAGKEVRGTSIQDNLGCQANSRTLYQARMKLDNPTGL